VDAGEAEALNADLPIKVDENETPRAYVARWLQLRGKDPDLTINEAARQLRIPRKTLNAAIQQAVANGWLRFEDPLSRLEFEIVPKVINNLNAWLDENDKTVTIEAAKGMVFPVYREAKGVSEAPQTVLALKIESPTGEQSSAIMTGQILGTPRNNDKL
jgi:hypothetical protein